jgi:AraC-like DNA-binding protein
VRAAASRDEYLAAPFGCYCAGAGFLHFFFDETLCGTTFWGRPDAAAIGQLTRIIDVELPAHSPPHSALVDARRLTAIDEEAFRVLSGFLGARAEAFGVNIIRQAILRPGGVVGALVAGFYDVTPAMNREVSRMCVEPAEALAWLGRGPEILVEIDAAQAQASGVGEAPGRLREWLRSRPRKLTLDEAARALQLAPRALQSLLHQQGSSFRRELNLARVELAKEFLAGSDTKLSAVALDVGCGSLSHFSSLFRRETGCSPSEWRRRYRR